MNPMISRETEKQSFQWPELSPDPCSWGPTGIRLLLCLPWALSCLGPPRSQHLGIRQEGQERGRSGSSHSQAQECRSPGLLGRVKTHRCSQGLPISKRAEVGCQRGVWPGQEAVPSLLQPKDRPRSPLPAPLVSRQVFA